MYNKELIKEILGYFYNLEVYQLPKLYIKEEDFLNYNSSFYNKFKAFTPLDVYNHTIKCIKSDFLTYTETNNMYDITSVDKDAIEYLLFNATVF